MPFYLSKALAIAFANFLSHAQENEDPHQEYVSHHSTFNLEYVSHHLWYLYIFTWNFHSGCYIEFTGFALE